MILEFLQKNVLLVVAAVTSGGMLLWPLLRRAGGGPGVDTLQATQMINRQDAVMLDVREAAEIAPGRILGARHIPLDQLAARAAEVSKKKDRPVIAYCDSGRRGAKAVAILVQAGYANVFNLNGGYGAWVQAGLPVEK